MHDGFLTLECPSCSYENAWDAKFCENCGASLVWVCSSCGIENAPQAKFCKNCGTRVEHLSTPKCDARLKTLQQTVPRGLKEKMREAREDIEGERKPVTILFADIVGSTAMAEKLDPEEWKEIVSGAHLRVSEAIYRYEGTIAQLLGDGVLAFFGAPITHEDDPIRAVHAALDIQEAITEYRQDLGSLVDDFRMRIGIHSGTVVIGDIGTDLHKEYLALGDAVHLAARLQSAAQPGKVLLSEASAHLVRSAFDLKDLGKIELKGKSKALLVFEVDKAKITPESGRGIEGLASPLVGREHELEVLYTSLTSLIEGHGQIIALLGEAGIGKTRLLEEARGLITKEQDEQSDRATPRPSIHWLEGRSLSYGTTLSFWPITQLFLEDLGLSEGAPEARIRVTMRRRVSELFGEDGAEVLPFLFHLLGIRQRVEEDELIRQLDGETLKRQVLFSISEYFRRLALQGPSVLIFEDMHWADPSTLEALGHLLALTDRVPLMTLMIMRIDRDHGSWQLKLKVETNFAYRYHEIHLGRLSSTESDQLVNHLLKIAELPASARDLILARSEGNPFYLEEIIRSLIDQGVVVHEDNTWRAVKEIMEVTIPDTLQGVLLARIDRLEEDVRNTLQMAAVIGKSFLYRLLEAIAEAERHLDTHLAQLQRADLVLEKARWPDLEYIFKHSLTQEAAYNSLLFERRKIYHLHVGEAIEKLFPDRQEEFLGLLARHFEAAQANEKAIDYLLRAGDRARLEDAHDEAIDYYHRALKLLELAKDDSRSARTWLKLGLIHQTYFEFDAAHKANEKAFALELKAKEEFRAPIEDDQRSILPHRTLRFALEIYPGTLDPGKADNSLQLQIVKELFAGLADLDSDTNVVPHVARSWEVLEEGRRYVFHLREDVRWTDGTPVTAEDFEWTWIRNLSLGADFYMTSLLDAVVGALDYRLGLDTDPKAVGVRALNSTTLEVLLKTPVPFFIYLVTQPNTYPLPRAIIERYGDEWWKPEHIVSNGPFRLVRYDEKGAIIEKNPVYFAEFPGNLDRIEWQIQRNEEARVQEYLEDKVDVTWNLLPKLIPAELPLDEVHYDSQSLDLTYIAFNLRRPPLDDVRVRKALAHALDRRQLLEVSIGRKLPQVSGGVVPPGMAGHSPELGLRYDVELAKQYLTEAGYPDSRDFPKLKFSVPESPIDAEVRRQWREALGIESIFLVRNNTDDRLNEFDTHGVGGGWVADYPDPDSMLRLLISFNLRQWGWHNARYDDLVERAARTPDRGLRLAMYREADRILVAEDVLILPLFYGGIAPYPDLVKPWVKNFRSNAMGYVSSKNLLLEPHQASMKPN